MNTETKEAHIKKFSAKLEQAQARLDLLKARAREADADTRLRINKEIDDIKERRADLERRMDELKSAGGDAWDDVKAGLDEGWQALSRALDQATSRFSA
jgi:DNA repair exonuclease SbcCD ATPase subunit